MQQNEPQEVADAIRDHYKPQGAGDSVPTAPVSICVALADKLDTLISMFAIGEKPTGSKDPFALRRAALGVIRIILENDVRISLLKLLDENILDRYWAIVIYPSSLTGISFTTNRDNGTFNVCHNRTATSFVLEGIPKEQEKFKNHLLAFFHDRLKVQLKDSGIRHDVIDASIMGDDDLVRIVTRAKAVQEFITTDNGKNLLAAYKRASNILSIEEKKDGIIYNRTDFDDTLPLESAERALRFHHSPERNEELLTWLKNEQYKDFMGWLATLRTPVDQFFEKIMVNSEEPHIRANRLRLLAMIKGVMDDIADFSKIEG
jgi:glycyl-tRNA synthetase beta chain